MLVGTSTLMGEKQPPFVQTQNVTTETSRVEGGSPIYKSSGPCAGTDYIFGTPTFSL
jgi:hypothetical protein